MILEGMLKKKKGSADPIARKITNIETDSEVIQLVRLTVNNLKINTNKFKKKEKEWRISADT